MQNHKIKTIEEKLQEEYLKKNKPKIISTDTLENKGAPYATVPIPTNVKVKSKIFL